MKCKGNQKRLRVSLPRGVSIAAHPRFWPVQGLGMVGRSSPAWRSAHPLELTSSPDSGGIQDPHPGQDCGVSG